MYSLCTLLCFINDLVIHTFLRKPENESRILSEVNRRKRKNTCARLCLAALPCYYVGTHQPYCPHVVTYYRSVRYDHVPYAKLSHFRSLRSLFSLLLFLQTTYSTLAYSLERCIERNTRTQSIYEYFYTLVKSMFTYLLTYSDLLLLPSF